MYRTIRADKVVDTASSLRTRVHARFPESGLLRVADELLDIARESQERCRAISRPLARTWGTSTSWARLSTT